MAETKRPLERNEDESNEGPSQKRCQDYDRNQVADQTDASPIVKKTSRRGDGKKAKRPRRGTRPEGDEKPSEQSETTFRLPKRQCALLIGFNGSGYNGMQMCVHLQLAVTYICDKFVPQSARCSYNRRRPF
jgi:hypothetical protein